MNVLNQKQWSSFRKKITCLITYIKNEQMLWTKISLCSIFKGHALERTSKLVAWWSPNHDLEQNGNAHQNNLKKKKKKTKPKPIFRPDNPWL